MKFRAFLTEQDFSIDEIVKILEKDCKPYIKELKKAKQSIKVNVLWRGIGRHVVGIEKFKARKNRRPLHTDPKLHKFLDKISKKIFGFPMRSQGVFTSTVADEASTFGIPHQFYPLGNFDAYWAPMVSDSKYMYPSFIERYFILNFEQALSEYNHWIRNTDFWDISELSFEPIDPLDEDAEKKLVRQMERVTEFIMKRYVKGSLSKALKDWNPIEVIIKCKEYYLLEYGLGDEVYWELVEK